MAHALRSWAAQPPPAHLSEQDLDEGADLAMIVVDLWRSGRRRAVLGLLTCEHGEAIRENLRDFATDANPTGCREQAELEDMASDMIAAAEILAAWAAREARRTAPVVVGELVR